MESTAIASIVANAVRQRSLFRCRRHERCYAARRGILFDVAARRGGGGGPEPDSARTGGVCGRFTYCNVKNKNTGNLETYQ